MKECEICNNRMTDLSYGKEDPHYICHTCKSHIYKNIFYAKKEWENWIENFSYGG